MERRKHRRKKQLTSRLTLIKRRWEKLQVYKRRELLRNEGLYDEDITDDSVPSLLRSKVLARTLMERRYNGLRQLWSDVV